MIPMLAEIASSGLIGFNYPFDYHFCYRSGLRSSSSLWRTLIQKSFVYRFGDCSDPVPKNDENTRIN